MATKKTNSRAKTNTRKTAAKTAKSTRAASTKARASTRAKVAPKAAAVKAAVVVESNKSVIKRLLELHRMSAGAFLLLAVLAGYFIRNVTINITLGHLTNDDLVSTTFAPAVHGIYDLNLRWAVVVIMALSAVLPLLWSLRWRRQYELNVEAEAMPQRWIEMAITGGLMVEVIALLSGVQDLLTLKLVGGLMVISCGLAWLADRENRQADKAKWSAFVFGVVAGSLPWLLILGTAFATFFYGMVRSPWYVYALYGTTLLSFILLAWTQRQHYRRANQWKFDVVERNYVLINFLLKAAFGAILIVGLHK